MVTYDPGIRARAADVAALAPRAVITILSQLDVVPDGARAYVSVGDDDARAFAGRLPGAVSRASGLFIEQREALVLTGAHTAQEAAEMIGARVPIVVVSLGADGAVACINGRAVRVSGYDVGPSIDTTGAGDLFVAAWTWGESVGMDVDDALQWAALYAALSVRVPTGTGGASRLGEFIEEGTRRGLPTPPARGQRVA
jgi:ribokinase